MPQRINPDRLAVHRLRRRRVAHASADARKRRSPSYRWTWRNPYRVHVGDGIEGEGWGGYLRRMTDRPGWSVARLARDSGVHRGTIFKWLAGKSGVNAASVRAIADALGDDPANAMRAATGNIEDHHHQDRDPEEDLVLSDPELSDRMKVRIILLIRKRRELDRTAAMEATRILINLMKQTG